MTISKENGNRAENFIQGFLRAQKSHRDFYDFETSKSLIEVKSCRSLIHSPTTNKKCSFQQGRFRIDMDNHIALLLESIMTGKKPLYAFVVKIGNSLIPKFVRADDLILPNNKYVYIPYGDIFYGRK
jgi:hypothetical protein